MIVFDITEIKATLHNTVLRKGHAGNRDTPPNLRLQLEGASCVIYFVYVEFYASR